MSEEGREEKPLIIAEEDSYFIIYKPSGWVVNNATTTKAPTIQNWLYENEYQYELKNDYENRNGIVHRLDKETSGVLIVAKNLKAMQAIQSQFKERKVNKSYVALAHGKIEPKKDVINASVGRLPWNRERFGVLAGGREAITNYEVIDYYTDNKNIFYTYVECFPKTGRTHQIRIHLKHIYHPIVSDTFYAGRKTSRNDRKWCDRLFLHAKSIEFVSPDTQKKVKYEANLPHSLRSVLDRLHKI